MSLATEMTVQERLPYAAAMLTPTLLVMDETWILLDPNTGLHVAWYFWLRVLDEVNRSVRYGSPFALLLLEPQGDSERPSGSLIEAAGRVPAAVRSTDLAGIVGWVRVGVILTQQDLSASETARDRVLERLEKTSPKGIRWDAQLLCYPEDGAEISNLLTTGRQTRSFSATPEMERLA
jgi:hypothetical protein